MAYIKGIAAISPQQSFGNQSISDSAVPVNGVFNCIEPDYTNWIDPRAIRRMSKVIRIGVATAVLALKEAGIEKPDAILAGTGLGCVADTTQFLTKLIENKEEALNPTPFIQSTHNTIASQIALILQCLGYNQTYSQRGFSFECALQDALMMLIENPSHQILVGGVDEVTDFSAFAFDNLGLGQVPHGEGAAFFALSNSSENAWAKIEGIRSVYKPEISKEVTTQLEDLLQKSAMKREEVDMVLVGATGNEKYDSVMNEVVKSFSSSRLYNFKNLCGEYSVASSFALWLASLALKKGLSSATALPKSVLIYNQYFNQHHSLTLLRGC